MFQVRDWKRDENGIVLGVVDLRRNSRFCMQPSAIPPTARVSTRKTRGGHGNAPLLGTFAQWKATGLKSISRINARFDRQEGGERSQKPEYVQCAWPNIYAFT